MVSIEDQQDVQRSEQQTTVAERLIPSDVVLTLGHVSKFFGPVQAVKDVSLDIHRGEVLTLLGPSGCGKTALLRMAVGLERVSEGEIYYSGRLVDSPSGRTFVPPHKRNTGVMFQSYAIWPHMTVFENVAYPLRTRKIKGDALRERVGQALEQVGLPGYEQRPATTLSVAQRQLVALARALVFEPDILLLDEPFANLDPKLRPQMRAQLRTLQQRVGITMLFATHDEVEALSLSDRIAVMHEGSIEQIGTPSKLYSNPATPSVWDSLGRSILFHGAILQRDFSGSVTVQLQDQDGPSIVARSNAADMLTQGNRCAITIRPEAVQVQPATASGAPNTVTGTISMLLFAGDRYEAAVDLPWAQTILIDLSAFGNWRIGQEIAVHLPAEEVRVWQV